MPGTVSTRVVIGLAAASLLIGCSRRESAPLSPELAEVYAELLSLVDGRDRAALEESQRQWLAHRENHCGMVDRLAAGTTDSPTDCYSAADATRLKELQQLHRAARLRSSLSTSNAIEQSVPGADELVTLESELPVNALALVPGTSLFATTTQTSVVVRDRSTGSAVRSLEVQPRQGSLLITKLLASERGGLLIIGTERSQMLQVWDPDTGRTVGQLDAGSQTAKVLLAGHGEFLVAGPANLQITNIATGIRQEGIYETTPIPSALAADPGERFLAAGTNGGTVELFAQEVRDGRLLLRALAKRTPFPRGDEVRGLSFSRNADSLIAISRSGAIRRWSVPALDELDAAPSSLSFIGYLTATPDHSVIFVSGGTGDGRSRGLIRALDLAGGRWKDVLADTRTNGSRIEFDPESQKLIVADSQLIRLLPVPRDRETFAAFQAARQGLLAEAAAAPAAEAPAPPRALLPGVSEGAVVYAVGVYQGALPGGARRGFRDDTPGTVEVTVGGAGPVILVLSAYESVHWVVKSDGARIDHVLTFSYEPQTVDAPRTARLFSDPQSPRQPGSIYAYERAGPGYASLATAVKELTGKDISVFQGKYEGSTFSINVSGNGAAPTNTIRRSVDENGVVTFEDAPRTPSSPAR